MGSTWSSWGHLGYPASANTDKLIEIIDHRIVNKQVNRYEFYEEISFNTENRRTASPILNELVRYSIHWDQTTRDVPIFYLIAIAKLLAFGANPNKKNNKSRTLSGKIPW